MEKNKIKELEIFRGISAIFIVLYHYTVRYNISFGHLKQPYYFNVEYGYMAVAVFFILSGFLIALKLEKEQNQKKFIIKRIIRLYPSYIIGMILTTAFLMIGGETFKTRLCSLKEWIMNLTMIPSVLGFKMVDGVYWTLGKELIFYIIISLIITVKKQNKIKNISLIWIVISLIVNILSNFSNNIILKMIKLITISDYSQLFITGIIMSILYKNQGGKTVYVIGILCLLNQYITQGIEYTIFLILFDIIYFLVIIKKHNLPKIINNKFIVFFSNISYPLYLTHQFIGFVIIDKIEKMGLTNEIYIIIPIVISILIAYLIHILIEKPMSKFLLEKFFNDESKSIYKK